MVAATSLLATISDYSPLLWGAAAGIAVGLFIHWIVSSRILRNARVRVARIVDEARSQAQRVAAEAREQGDREHEQWMREFSAERREVEEGLEDLQRLLGERERDLNKRDEEAAARSRSLDDLKRGLRGIRIRKRKKERELRRMGRMQRGLLLERAGLTEEEAKSTILRLLESEVEREQADWESARLEVVREDLEKRARKLISVAIGRCTVGHDDNGVTGTLSLPSEDFKNRLLGPEGRNLRVFEELTGVNLIFDEHDPLVIVLSAFDGMRKAIARRALEKLISQNSAIQPGRIKDFVEKATREMRKITLETGRKVAADLRIRGVNPEILGLLGRLNYRTSYGQNVLEHSKEVAFLAATLAAEIGIDTRLAKRCGLLHDIGKAVDADLEGGHPEIGADIARRCDEPAPVIDAIARHHDDSDKIDTFPLLTQTADAVSGSRPGARRETLERYLKHLEQLEAIGQSFGGVETAYAMQAGRELRVFVDPERVSDEEVGKICRGITERVENELTYPGKIKITVVREQKTGAYAR